MSRARLALVTSLLLLQASCGGGAQRDAGVPEAAGGGHELACADQPGWRRVLRLRGPSPRLFPELRILHDPGPEVALPEQPLPKPTGNDYEIEPGGSAVLIRGKPFAGDVGTRFVDVVGTWPSEAWGLAEVANALYGSVPIRALMEWNGREWREVLSPTTMLSEGDIYLQRWGRDGAVALPFLFTELIGEGPAITREVTCSAGVQRLGSPGTRVPVLSKDDCSRSIEAFGASPSGEAFVVGRACARPAGAVESTCGPLEVDRWRAGATAPARDDLDATLGFAARSIDAWGHRTLVVSSASDAYLAVLTGRDETATPSEQVLVLHYDGRIWSEVLSTPPPWAGVERADDGSVWIASGGALFVQPSSTPLGFRPVVSGITEGSDHHAHTIVPQQVMPWSATRASVIGRYGDEVGLFTVTASEAGTSQPRMNGCGGGS